MALADILVLSLSPLLAERLLSSISPLVSSGSPAPNWGLNIVFTGMNFLVMAALGLYHARQRSGMMEVVMRVLVSLGIGWVLLTLMSMMPDQPHFSDSTMALALLMSGLGAIVTRWLLEHGLNEDAFKRRVLVYGAGKRAASILQLRRRADRRGFTILNYVVAEGDVKDLVPDVQCIHQKIDLSMYCQEYLVDEVVVAMDDRRRNFPMHELLCCRLDGVEVTELVSFLERETGKVRLDVLNPSWMIFSDGFRRGFIHAKLERIMDIVASMVLLTFAAPVMLLTMLAIKMEEGWSAPILYGQTRVGARGKLFRLLKFRSMRVDAEREGKAVWAKAKDHRATRVGSIIRKIRIDELPQVINVLKGEMSFVGPRPERPEFAEELEQTIPYYRERHTIKPGITGWAQLCYPYGSSERDAVEKLQYDLYYIKNQSLIFYIVIVLQTVEVVLWRKGSR